MSLLPDSTRFTAALAQFDAINAEDPNQDSDAAGRHWPKELLYAYRMSACLDRVAPAAPEALRLAARCQHIRRWAIPRQSFPMTRPGYHQWRNSLKQYHAEQAGQVLAAVGYDAAVIARVQALVQKQQLAQDADVQLLEDVICLVFLEYYFLDFARQHPEEKVIDIVQKTWRKMTPQGHEWALQLPLVPEAQTLVAKALT
ncbi:DUF4202 domain-containing protein [Hymenobacter negativus]|uniref:DUF4202 domain-containing protein n=1 Tax=Hymenobacter negativus TaxID=2795026 RepID=A0ABS3QMP2_9BACT|nr:DUF4202 domain-containing protein [Hymenobacter negativus]MBO2012530.1 DUF4202 domain-containing protein [Hymenobacter negativus]